MNGRSRPKAAPERPAKTTASIVAHPTHKDRTRLIRHVDELTAIDRLMRIKGTLTAVRL
jgi:hypothetical protein